jgi:hypothetical protein
VLNAFYGNLFDHYLTIYILIPSHITSIHKRRRNHRTKIRLIQFKLYIMIQGKKHTMCSHGESRESERLFSKIYVDGCFLCAATITIYQTGSILIVVKFFFSRTNRFSFFTQNKEGMRDRCFPLCCFFLNFIFLQFISD